MSWVNGVLVLVALGSVWLVPGAAAAQDQPRFSVMGVVIRPGVSIAWIGEPTLTKDNFVRVLEGQRIGPYQVVKILEDRVELTGPSGPMVVRLSSSGSDTQPSSQTGSAVARPAPDPETEAAYARRKEGWALNRNQGFQRLLEFKKRGDR
jgi:hypothetical protein